jgi:hypothetical protein
MNTLANLSYATLLQCALHGCLGKGRAGTPLPAAAHWHRKKRRTTFVRRAGDGPPCQPALGHEKILLFTACQPGPRLLKANQETGKSPFQKNLFWPCPARWSVEKIQLTQLPEVLLPG